MWPKLKAAASTLPHDLTIMADEALGGGRVGPCRDPGFFLSKHCRNELAPFDVLIEPPDGLPTLSL